MDYRETLQLPKTDFPMRANLPEREPIFLRYWQENDLYAAGLRRRTGAEPFVLHDGPPYANGNIHIGTSLNKVLKDTVSRFQTMAGRPSPYVPGWDTHGLPIERKALEELKRDRHNLDPLTLRRACRDFAMHHIEVMTGQFQRLGVIGDWGHPYITLQPEYEAAELRVFGEMYERGLVYKGFRSVHWCPIDETALADAEIEYREHTSPSIYVAFPVADAGGCEEVEGAALVIWTTTPWTMPANEAVALHPDLEYGVYESPQGPLVVAAAARARMEKVLSLGKELAALPARSLAKVRMLHPIFDGKTVPVVFGGHVSSEDGTGAVHTAPGHGEEDFQVGKEYGLPVTVPVDDQGNFNELAGPFRGQRYDKANPAIMAYLQERGRLLQAGEIRHQYPHCWRCHGPVLFRATEQWFGSVSAIREDILAAIAKVSWVPEWGEVRMRQMTQDRQDWCISRQRVWGVPIPAFYCEGCGELLVTRETVSHVADLVAQHGADVWWERSAQELLPAGAACRKCGGQAFRKETDILDVWFDSGSSHAAVLSREGLHRPADLYLEGADQFRGWFNSSLTTSVAVNGEPPYREVLVHGFVVDGEGKKMSKSLQNAVSPEAVLKQYGADILRLWATSADYTADIHLTPEILQQVAEGYRKIRNTWRFLLGNLADFDPARDAVPLGELQGLEAYMRGRLGELVRTVRRAYESYGYQGVYYHGLNFCAVDLSSLYLDVRKDLLYCAAKDDPQRRAAQTFIWHAASVLARLFAPILAFTAEEVWEYLPGARQEQWSVHLADFPQAEDYAADAEVESRFAQLLDLRDEALKALEEARAEKRIGKPGDARLELSLPQGPLLDLCRQQAETLAELCIVSSLKVSEGARAISVAPDPAPRCERCWLHRDDVGADGLCGRCEAVLAR